MESSSLTRRGGLVAVLSGVLGIVYFPFHASAYLATEGTTETPLVPWTGAFRSLFEPLLTFAPPDDVYMTYGMISPLVILGLLAGTAAFHARQAERAGRLEKWAFRIAFVGTALLTLGAIGEYWVGALDFSFIALSLPGFFLMMFGMTMFGIGTLRAGVAPRSGAWLLIVGGFPGIILMTILFGHLSAGLLLLYIGWVVLGYALWSERGAPAARHHVEEPV